MTFRLGLTGSIGMGKSTTARLFAEEGCAVWDADAAVHRLYAPGGAAVAPLARVFPDAIADGAVSRPKLKQIVARDPQALARIEAIVHPLVTRDRQKFVAEARTDIAVFDIPLLFETGAEKMLDAVACVTVSHETQGKRVLARRTMTEAEFEALRAKQLSDAEKRARADYVIVTDTVQNARRQVKAVIDDIKRKMDHA